MLSLLRRLGPVEVFVLAALAAAGTAGQGRRHRRRQHQPPPRRHCRALARTQNDGTPAVRRTAGVRACGRPYLAGVPPPGAGVVGGGTTGAVLLGDDELLQPRVAPSRAPNSARLRSFFMDGVLSV